eukprot:448933-Rhodomonas_salina.1
MAVHTSSSITTVAMKAFNEITSPADESCATPSERNKEWSTSSDVVRRCNRVEEKYRLFLFRPKRTLSPGGELRRAVVSPIEGWAGTVIDVQRSAPPVASFQRAYSDGQTWAGTL